MQLLYGKDKNGKYKVWNCWTEGAELYIMHGQEGGKQQTKQENVKGVNVGRANETTDEQQAMLEATSRWKKQTDKGYRESKEELEDVGIAAMLSQDYNKKPHLIKFPCLVSKKIDGCRCLAIKTNGKVLLQSRGNKHYDIPHITDALNDCMVEGDIYDGELYIEGMALQDIMSAVKKPNANTPRIVYLVFDIPSVPSNFLARYNTLVFEMEDFQECIQAVEHFEVADVDGLKFHHGLFVSDGYEGLMIRNLDGMYESGKRSNNLSKYKTFLDSEFQILGVDEDKNGGAVFTVQNTFANNTFTVVGGSHEERKAWLANKELYIGKWITVKYQTLYLDTLLPQFPVMTGFRVGSVADGQFIAGE